MRDWVPEEVGGLGGGRAAVRTLFKFPSSRAYSSSTSCSRGVRVSVGDGAEFCDVERCA